MRTYTKEEIISMYGEETANRAFESAAEPTSRTIYPASEPEHAGMQEWAGECVTAANGDRIRAYYYFTGSETENNPDPSFWNWSNPEFQVE